MRIELGDTLCITVSANSKNPADGSVVFDCRAVNQRDEEIITGTNRPLQSKASGRRWPERRIFS